MGQKSYLSKVYNAPMGIVKGRGVAIAAGILGIVLILAALIWFQEDLREWLVLRSAHQVHIYNTNLDLDRYASVSIFERETYPLIWALRKRFLESLSDVAPGFYEKRILLAGRINFLQTRHPDDMNGNLSSLEYYTSLTRLRRRESFAPGKGITSVKERDGTGS